MSCANYCKDIKEYAHLKANFTFTHTNAACTVLATAGSKKLQSANNCKMSTITPEAKH